MDSNKLSLPENFAVRKATENDRPFLYELYCQCNSDVRQGLNVNPDRLDTYLMSQFNIQFRTYEREFTHGEMFILFDNNEPAGRIFYEPLETEIYLVDISLLPDYQRKGLGSKLLDALKSSMSSGQKVIAAEIEEYSPAVGFLQANGFIQKDQWDKFLIMEYPGE